MSNDLAVLEQAFAPLTDKFTQVLAVPGVNLTAPRLIRSVLFSCGRTPKLLQCSRQSLFNAAMSAACLGLEVDGVTGQAFLIPYELRAGGLTAQLVIGYKGYNTMAARSGITVTGEVVRDGDAFDFDEGEGWVKHRKVLGRPDRRIIAVWSKAAALDRPAVVKVLDISDVLAIKAKAPGARKPDSPWNDTAIGFPAMAEKSAKRRLARAMPLNVMVHAARLEEAFEEQGRPGYITPDRGVIIESEPEAPQPAAAELTTVEKAPELELGPREPRGMSHTERLSRYDGELTMAAKDGVRSLDLAWGKMPHEYRVSLQSAYERRHLPTARGVDNASNSNGHS